MGKIKKVIGSLLNLLNSAVVIYLFICCVIIYVVFIPLSPIIYPIICLVQWRLRYLEKKSRCVFVCEVNKRVGIIQRDIYLDHENRYWEKYLRGKEDYDYEVNNPGILLWHLKIPGVVVLQKDSSEYHSLKRCLLCAKADFWVPSEITPFDEARKKLLPYRLSNNYLLDFDGEWKQVIC